MVIIMKTENIKCCVRKWRQTRTFAHIAARIVNGNSQWKTVEQFLKKINLPYNSGIPPKNLPKRNETGAFWWSTG